MMSLLDHMPAGRVSPGIGNIDTVAVIPWTPPIAAHLAPDRPADLVLDQHDGRQLGGHVWRSAPEP
jgi:hypothetical protein